MLIRRTKSKDFMRAFGSVVSVRVVRDKDGKPRGYAFVEFDSESALRRAFVEADARKLDGRVSFFFCFCLFVCFLLVFCFCLFVCFVCLFCCLFCLFFVCFFFVLLFVCSFNIFSFFYCCFFFFLLCSIVVDDDWS